MSSGPTPSPLPSANIPKARVYQPFHHVWTPRTPDSSYDSFAGLTPPLPIVYPPPLTETQLDPKTQTQQPVFIGTGVTVTSAVYLANVVVAQPTDRVGTSVTIHSAIYH